MKSNFVRGHNNDRYLRASNKTSMWNVSLYKQIDSLFYSCCFDCFDDNGSISYTQVKVVRHYSWRFSHPRCAAYMQQWSEAEYAIQHIPALLYTFPPSNSNSNLNEFCRTENFYNKTRSKLDTRHQSKPPCDEIICLDSTLALPFWWRYSLYIELYCQ